MDIDFLSNRERNKEAAQELRRAVLHLERAAKLAVSFHNVIEHELLGNVRHVADRLEEYAQNDW